MGGAGHRYNEGGIYILYDLMGRTVSNRRVDDENVEGRLYACDNCAEPAGEVERLSTGLVCTGEARRCPSSLEHEVPCGREEIWEICEFSARHATKNKKNTNLFIRKLARSTPVEPDLICVS